MMRTIIPGTIPVKDMHQYLLGTVAPRPIAFVSTLDEHGKPNLAPYSFFNAFSSNPPIVVFSSNRRVDNNTTKDTLHNVKTTGECVINAVTYNILRQMAVTSVQYEAGISEFEKAGLTPVLSDEVKPFRVKESPAHMECRIKDIITLGEHGGAGHLVICDVLRMHISEDVLGTNNRINPHKMDLMGRMGRAYYVRASGDAIHTVYQPFNEIPIGYDSLPESIRSSAILTGNQLGSLAGMFSEPTEELLAKIAGEQAISELLKGGVTSMKAMHIEAAKRIDEGKSDEGMAILLLADRLGG